MPLYLLLALAPALIGWLTNRLILTPVIGTIAVFLQGPLCALFALWLGRRMARQGVGFLKALLVSQWPSLVSLPLYVWQFHFVAGEARSLFLAVLAQCPAMPLLGWAARLMAPFLDHYWGPPQTLAAIVISLALLAALFTAGYILTLHFQHRQAG